jgi:hypothetical protein
MRNVQSRVIDAPAPALGALLDGLASPADKLWPARNWPPIRLDRGLTTGSKGGHGSIRYSMIEYEPGVRIRFAFDPTIGATGYHELRVEPVDAKRARLVHEMVCGLHGRMRLLWPLAIRWLHEALLQDLLDNAQLAATGRLGTPVRWSRWVRRLRSRSGRPSTVVEAKP